MADKHIPHSRRRTRNRRDRIAASSDLTCSWVDEITRELAESAEQAGFDLKQAKQHVSLLQLRRRIRQQGSSAG
jgi:hypothetical protein